MSKQEAFQQVRRVIRKRRAAFFAKVGVGRHREKALRAKP